MNETSFAGHRYFPSLGYMHMNGPRTASKAIFRTLQCTYRTGRSLLECAIWCTTAQVLQYSCHRRVVRVSKSQTMFVDLVTARTLHSKNSSQQYYLGIGKAKVDKTERPMYSEVRP